MRIIAFGDVHMSVQICANIPGIREADLLIANGDLTNYGRKADAKIVLDQLLAINPNLLAQIGNLDNFEINDYLEQLDMNLHKQARLLHSRICLIGLGGSNITPFGTPTEFKEDQLWDMLMQAYQQGTDFIHLAAPKGEAKIPLVLVSHTPPYGTSVDTIHGGHHVGSTSVRTFIEKYQPELCITGHIHEAKGEDRIGKTHIINPGMLQQGGWVDIQLIQSTLSATLQ
ncbi:MULTISPECIES: metallophosphoesterase family protein [Desulfosediminicola]|uniref:metallophosphoesterase family protein n=1 Tax=Desulfosediminicola TaxID=2886823 RepID=UPI0010AC828A|nr:metallophosphoesterase [Desulfosediminicola ganghwensis]